MSNTPFIGPPHDLDVLLTPSHGAIFRCLAVHLVCSCRVVTIVYPMFAQHSLARVSTLSSRYCTTILSALQLYNDLSTSTSRTCVAATFFFYHNISHTSPLVMSTSSFSCIVFPPRAELELPNQVPTRPNPLNSALSHACADFLFVGSSSIRQKADRHHSSLFRAFFSISEDVSPFAPHLSPLTPSLVTLARQRGPSCTSVHVNVKWSDVLFFPHRDRTCAKYNYNCPASTPFLPLILPRFNRSWNQNIAFEQKESRTRMWPSVFTLSYVVGIETHACHLSLAPSNSCPVPGTLLSLCSSPRVLF